MENNSWAQTLKNFAEKHWKLILLTSFASVAVGGATYYALSSTRSSKKTKRPSVAELDSNESLDSSVATDIPFENNNSPLNSENEEKYVATSKSNDKEVEEADAESESLKVDFANLTEDERDKIALSFKTRGNKYFAGRKFEKAISLYSKAIELYPATDKRTAVYYSNRAACYANLNEFDKVIEDSNAALAADSLYVKAFARRGNAFEKKEMYSEALEDFTVACILEEFKNQSNLMAADRNLKTLVTQRSKEVFSKLKHEDLPSHSFVSAYLNSFSYEYLAPEEMQNLIPGSGDAIFVKAVNAFNKKDWDKSLKHCINAIQASPQKFMAKALNLRGTFNFLKGSSDAAREDYEESYRLDPLNVNTHIKIASSLMEKDLESGLVEAEKWFKKALELEPNNADIYYHRGQVFFLTQDFKKAMADYKKCLELNSNFFLARIQLAVVSYRLGDVSVAHDLLEEAKKLYPKSAEVFYYHGEILLDQQRIDEAMEMFERTIEINPSLPLPYLNKGIIYFHMLNDMERASEYTQKAIDVDPKCDLAYSHLAQMFMHQGRLDEAIIVYKKAADLSRSIQDVETAIMGLEAVKAQAAAIKKIGKAKK